jgi:hypothetical protein
MINKGETNLLIFSLKTTAAGIKYDDGLVLQTVEGTKLTLTFENFVHEAL